MTVSSETSRKTFAGNGATVAFGTSPMVFFDEADLLIYVTVDATGVSTLKTITTHYTVSGGSGSIGTVTMVTAPATGEKLVIVRDVAITQGSDFVNNDSSDAEVIEDALDRLTMIEQQHESTLGRVLRQPPGDITAIGDLPNVVDRASSFLAFNASGNPVPQAAISTALVSVSAFAVTLLDDTTAAAMFTTLGIPAVEQNTLATPQATTSGNTKVFSGLPAGVKRISMSLVGVSTNGANFPLIQIGDSGGIEATGYLGGSLKMSSGASGVVNAHTTGFGICSGDAAAILHGTIALTLENSTTNTWTAAGSVWDSANNYSFTVSGSKSLSAVLDRVQITMPDTFDAGAVNIQYEVSP